MLKKALPIMFAVTSCISHHSFSTTHTTQEYQTFIESVQHLTKTLKEKNYNVVLFERPEFNLPLCIHLSMAGRTESNTNERLSYTIDVHAFPKTKKFCAHLLKQLKSSHLPLYSNPHIMYGDYRLSITELLFLEKYFNNYEKEKNLLHNTDHKHTSKSLKNLSCNLLFPETIYLQMKAIAKAAKKLEALYAHDPTMLQEVENHIYTIKQQLLHNSKEMYDRIHCRLVYVTADRNQNHWPAELSILGAFLSAFAGFTLTAYTIVEKERPKTGAAIAGISLCSLIACIKSAQHFFKKEQNNINEFILQHGTPEDIAQLQK